MPGPAPVAAQASRQVGASLITALVLLLIVQSRGPSGGAARQSVRVRVRNTSAAAGMHGDSAGEFRLGGVLPGGRKKSSKGSGKPCCRDTTARCMSCAVGVDVAVFCGRHPGYVGCPGRVHEDPAHPAKQRGGRRGGAPLEGAGTARVTPDDVRRGAQCLPGGGEGLKLSYPADADEHFEAIHKALAQYTENERPHRGSGYSGPWIENHWIATFRGRYHEARKSGGKLSDVFGPFVPLLLPLVDMFVNHNPHGFRYPGNFTTDLKRVLRPDVLYVTVSQNDEGIEGGVHDDLSMTRDVPNLVVLSAGGYGHVPVPLLKQPVSPCPKSDPKKRKYAAVFAGTLGHAPHKMRERMGNAVNEFAKAASVDVFVGKENNWQGVMCDARVSLCPRGFGRTSFRLAETVGAGRVPVTVFSDQDWVPYGDLFNTFGFSSNVSALPALLARITAMPPAEIAEREAAVASIASTHFTYAGAMEQIELFMLGRGSDLQCAPLPASTRDADNK